MDQSMFGLELKRLAGADHRCPFDCWILVIVYLTSSRIATYSLKLGFNVVGLTCRKMFSNQLSVLKGRRFDLNTGQFPDYWTYASVNSKHQHPPGLTPGELI